MGCFRRAIGGIVVSNLLGTCRNIPHVDCPVEEGKSSDGLVIRDFMSRLIDTCKGEVPVFSRLAVLDAVDHHRCVTCLSELVGIGVVCSEADCLTAKPVADVIRIPVDERNANAAVENHFEIVNEVRPDEVASLLKCEVDLVVRVLGVVGINAYCLLGRCQIQEVLEV